MLLAIKLLLVPAFLVLISLAGKRWGASAAGWLAGFPVVAGPILFFLAVESGAQFAAQAATTALSAVFASVAFSVVYAWSSQRRGWFRSLLFALCAWTLAALILALLVDQLWKALSIAACALAIAPMLFPRVALPLASNPLPKKELALRMLAGAALTLLVTFIASAMGPARSGLLAVFPVLGSVLSVFSHIDNGPRYTAALLRAMSMGLWSLAAFTSVLSLSLRGLTLANAFIVALLAAVVAQMVMRSWVMRDRK
jgi:uncharacterized membrane protein (GlpM family)